MKKSKLSHRIAAAVTVGAMMGVSGEALAGNATTADMANLTQNIATTTGNFNTLMSLLGYVGGTGMSIAGIFKLKAHVDSPANAPLKDGLMRLAAGGALLSLPLIVRVMQGGIGNGSQNATMSAATIESFAGSSGAAGGSTNLSG